VVVPRTAVFDNDAHAIGSFGQAAPSRVQDRPTQQGEHCTDFEYRDVPTAARMCGQPLPLLRVTL
jgi:hypothetical protein